VGYIHVLHLGLLQANYVRFDGIDHLSDVLLFGRIIHVSDIPTNNFVLINQAIHGHRQTTENRIKQHKQIEGNTKGTRSQQVCNIISLIQAHITYIK
jgi:hypothetical protein